MECTNCGTELAAHQTHCPLCGKPTVYYRHQRRCLHCGTPAAAQAKTCLMCGQSIDSLPLSESVFSGSWTGIILGIIIVVGAVFGLNYLSTGPQSAAVAAAPSPSPTPSRTPTITPTFGPTLTPTATATLTPTPTATPQRHVIESGDTLIYLAQLYNTTVDELVALNSIGDAAGLRVGEELLIPPAQGQAAGDQRDNYPAQIVYVIQEGDTLLGIALDHGTTVEAIASVNPDVNLDLIFPGQEVVVPLATPTPTPSPTASLTPTATPRPRYPAPALLSPADGLITRRAELLFNWTATGILADDLYYVLRLEWANGEQTYYWTKSTGQRVNLSEKSAPGPVVWTVDVMRRTGTDADGAPVGDVVTPGHHRRLEVGEK